MRKREKQKSVGGGKMHQYFHTTFGFCLWDLLALIVFVVLVLVLLVHNRNQKKRRKEMEERLAAQREGRSTISSQ